MKLTRVGVDLAKNVFQVHGVDEREKPVWKRRLKRATWLRVFTETVEPGCEVGMEACAGAHHWARELQRRGYRVKLIAPQFVKPYLKSQKDDAKDAAAICEAMSREEMRYVAVKTNRAAGHPGGSSGQKPGDERAQRQGQSDSGSGGGVWGGGTEARWTTASGDPVLARGR